MNKISSQKMIAPNDTFVDHTYQRSLDQARVNHIVNNYDPTMVRVPIVSIRSNGDKYLIDGQHTCAVQKALGRGNEPMSMQYREGLTVAEEAVAFKKANAKGKDGSLAVSARGQFKAGFAGGQTTETEIVGILQSLGLNVHHSIKYGVSAVCALRAVHCLNENLYDTMWVIKEWCPNGGHAYENDIIRGVSAFCKEYPTADKKHLTKALSAYLPSELKTRFKIEKTAMGANAPGDTTAYVAVIRVIYNKGLRSNRL